MELRQYLIIVLRWWWALLLGTVVTAGGAWALSTREAPIYETSATLLINQATGSTPSASYSDVLTSERLAQTYAQMVARRPVLENVVQQLNLPLPADELARKVSVSIVRDTLLLQVTVQDTNATRAAEIANKVSDVFIAQNIQTQLGQYAATEEALQSEIDKVQQDIRDTEADIVALGTPETSGAQVQLASLQTALSQYRTTYGSLVSSLRSIQLSESRAINSVTVIEQALPPTEPISPRPLRNALAGGLAGLLLAAGIVFLVEYLDDTLKTPDDVDHVATLPTLAGIARIRGDDLPTKLVTQQHPRSPIAEAYRVLRTGIQFSGIDHPTHSLLVTSPNPSEGKTTTAANLGIVMAQAGRRVLLLDADLRRPMLHELFQRNNVTGLTSLLLEVGEVGTAGTLRGITAAAQPMIQDTDTEGLSLLTSGPIPPNPSELLGSATMKAVLTALADSFDVVILDSPPVLAVTDAMVLATQVDGVLLVIGASKTRRGALAQAAERLRKVNANLIGVALNRLTPKSGGYYYHYYEYSGYYERKTPKTNGHGTNGRERAGQSETAKKQAG